MIQRTFITEIPVELKSNQAIVDLPRYEVPLTKSLIRSHGNTKKFSNDSEKLGIITTLSNIKIFVDELSQLDDRIDTRDPIPYTNYVGLQFDTVADAVKWARKFVVKFFPTTEELLLKRILLDIPLDKSEIIWLGGDKYLPLVQRIATSPNTEDVIKVTSIQEEKPQLTIEEASKKRAEIQARREALLAEKAKVKK